MKKGTQDHAKFNTMKALLKVPRYVVSGLLEELWSFAATSAIHGDVGRYTNFQIAANMEWDGDPDELIDALVKSGWLDEDDELRLVVHDWHEHSPDWVKKRIARAEAKLQKKKPPNPPLPDTPGASDNGGQRRTVADNGGQREKTSANGALTQSSQVKPSLVNSESAQPDDCSPSPDSKIPKVEQLDELLDEWEQLPRDIAPPVQDRRGKTLLKGWRRVQKDPEVRAAFENIPVLMARIRDGTFLHGEGWFRFPWLFAKGKTGEWNVLKILEGNYVEGKSKQQNRDPARINGEPESLKFFE